MAPTSAASKGPTGTARRWRRRPAPAARPGAPTLSAQAEGGAPAVNARDRVGKGPWVNAIGVRISASVDDLHSVNNKIDNETGLTETGRRIPGVGFVVNQHDVLTGSTADGNARLRART